MKMSDKIKVIMRVVEIVDHKIEAEMTQEEYDRYQAMNDRDLSGCVGDWTNGRVTTEDGRWEDGEIHIVK